MTDKRTEKIPRKSAIVINFPVPRADYHLSCPDCGKTRWRIMMVDMKTDKSEPHSVCVLRCLTRGCDFDTMGELHLGHEHYEPE